VLDQVQDPHNLGACLRSCEAFGAHAVIAPKRQSAGLTPAARKIASGAADVLPFFQVTNLTRVLKWLKSNGLWVVGTCEQASATLFDWDFTQPTVMVLGSESSGMRRLTRENCDQTVQIPTRGRINSLNVSVACGICLFEAGRQRYHC
jgi:23S rRNA (guanosine2251-2'-O)-methyltransferase